MISQVIIRIIARKAKRNQTNRAQHLIDASAEGRSGVNQQRRQ